MRSVWAVAAALTMLLAFPVAVAASVLGEDVPEIAVHVVLGIGMVLLALSLLLVFVRRGWVGTGRSPRIRRP